MKYSISQLVPQTKNVELSNRPLKWGKAAVMCISDN